MSAPPAQLNSRTSASVARNRLQRVDSSGSFPGHERLLTALRSLRRRRPNGAIGQELTVAVQRIDPTASNPYVQANAAGFRAGAVQITVKEYDTVLALHDEAGGVADQSPLGGQSS
jgi:hypothetical protein